LIVLFAGPRALKALSLLSRPRPAEAPAGYPVWPRWFSVVSFFHNRWFGNLFILGVALDMAVRLLLPGFWK
ncbi:MAG TPA: prenyltransferase, partial [Spirochaetia bacterium]|nr:prenyltransferase [Spirochaetia bacterium]